MTAWGHSRHLDRAPVTSGFTRETDILRCRRACLKVPRRDMPRAPKVPARERATPESVKERWIQTQMAVPASKKAAPSTTSASPGQFDLIPKPLAGLSGSSVSRPERSRFLPLNRPRQIG